MKKSYWSLDENIVGSQTSLDTISTSDILKTKITTKKGTIPAASNSKLLSATKYANYLRNGVAGANIQALASNDRIYGFDNTDMLKITGAFSNSYNKSKKEIYFKVGSTANAITLSDFSATSFNINGTNYKISGSKLVKK